MKKIILALFLLLVFLLCSCNLASNTNSNTNTSSDTSTNTSIDTSTDTSTSTEPKEQCTYLEFYLMDNDEYEVRGLLDESITDLVIPSTYEGKIVSAIRGEAFMSSAITSVQIPSTIDTIGYFAFGECKSLTYNEYENGHYLGNSENPYLVFVKPTSTDITEIKVHNDTKIINGGAFIQCKSLQSVEFGTSIVEIGMWCFYECDSLTSLAIPTGTKRLSALVCYKCPNLKTVMIPSTVESIFKNAFKRCDSLTTIVCAMEKAPEGFMQGWNDTSAEVIWWADK